VQREAASEQGHCRYGKSSQLTQSQSGVNQLRASVNGVVPESLLGTGRTMREQRVYRRSVSQLDSFRFSKPLLRSTPSQRHPGRIPNLDTGKGPLYLRSLDRGSRGDMGT
jgi:hypothetical protein